MCPHSRPAHAMSDWVCKIQTSSSDPFIYLFLKNSVIFIFSGKFSSILLSSACVPLAVPLSNSTLSVSSSLSDRLSLFLPISSLSLSLSSLLSVYSSLGSTLGLFRSMARLSRSYPLSVLVSLYSRLCMWSSLSVVVSLSLRLFQCSSHSLGLYLSLCVSLHSCLRSTSWSIGYSLKKHQLRGMHGNQIFVLNCRVIR